MLLHGSASWLNGQYQTDGDRGSKVLRASEPQCRDVADGVLKDIPDVSDAALWDWTNEDSGTGRLVAYRAGSTELFVNDCRNL